MSRTITSMNNGKTVRISLPNKSGNNNHRGIKYNATYSEGNSQTQSQEIDQSGNIGSFKPAFSPRRTYGNIKFLLEVMHKKVRAKAIQSTFQQCNYKLGMSLEMNKGFKGRKVAQNSLFHNLTQQKMKPKNTQLPQPHPQKTQHHIILSQRTQKFAQYLKTPKRQQTLRKQAKILYDDQISQRKNNNKSSTAGASLNIYRKKFKGLKKSMMDQHREEEIFGFLG